MNLRIECKRQAQKTVIMIAGRLIGDGVAELERLCDTAQRPLVLDLGDLLTADGRGIRLLRALADGGAELTGASPYIELLLDRRCDR